MAYEQLAVDLDGSVAAIRMNNPDKLNALSRTMTGELIQAFESFRDDPGVRAIVLTGQGRGFSAGADLGALQEPYLQGERPRLSEFLRMGYHRLIPLIAGAPKPVIAAVNGVTAGAGLSLALACDVRVASEEASFTTAFVKIGLVPDSGASYFLPRTVGMARAISLAITGDRIDADEALRIGLVDQVHPSDRFLAEATALAGRLAELPTVAIGLTKRLLLEASRLSLADTMEREAAVQDEAAASGDHLEGVLAFLQKRPASFTGR